MNIFTQPTDTQKHTLYGSGIFVFVFLILAFWFPDAFREKLGTWTFHILEVFGMFNLMVGLGSVLILLAIAFSPFGNRKLGKEKPEYSWFSWIAMLYSTGMGAGLLLRAVQEPVFYYTHPPRESVLSQGEFALQYTFFHWGLTPWAFYGLFGLVIAYNLYEKNGTILSSSVLEKRLQKTIWATMMDILTIICTLLGVVAAVGLGSRQLLDAAAYWMGLEEIPSNLSIWLVLLVCAVATYSAFLGLSRGIKIISNVNIGLASLLLFFTWIVGSECMVVGMFFKSLGIYLLEFVPMSLNIGDQKVSHSFLTDWTFFYWAFWLAWAPFTGVFMARISKGRTIRQFITGTLIVPALGTFIWFTVFGSNSFGLIESGNTTAESFGSIYSALFNFFSLFPYSSFSNTVSTILIFTFLITSVDSAIFVLSMFTDDGKAEPMRRYRMFWGVSIAMFTIVVILMGKESLLQSASQLLIIFALPFSFLFVGMVFYFLNSVILKKNKQR
ncbi:BCCT family transporter [Cognataquiflexum rubidum]|uniref:BCCT family transporter n=1 Tax=Cognataquiflexum rubidum TaxID=2922273 RepID=UPI001F12FCA5|nr:BCCT family transporter [Cognataquiflexum rubidum]MCH6232828.1 BCCT family transporter [Cognataquiflexum rubidum]